MDVDAQLLDRYARTRDADAFIQLVRRHAGMVFSVARRVTSDHHDAEDVAQSCFIELARHPAAIRGSLAGWLHAVATTRAADCNRAAGRRHHHEQAASRPEVQTPGEWEEVAPLVDAALAQLPEDQRVPVVLYYLEGRTLKQIAAELNIGTSTVSRRVETGVAALREKLNAAGVMAPSVVLPALLAQHALVAVPKTLMVMLGKVAVSGFVPGVSAAAASGGAAAVSGASWATSKSTAVLGMKVMAAVIVTAAVTTASVAVLSRLQPVVAATTPTGNGDDAIIMKLKAEITQGLGDGVGILTETWVHENPKTKVERTIPAALTLYGQQGRSRLFMEYVTRHSNRPSMANESISVDKMPEGWPAPSIENVLRFVDGVKTAALRVTDGHTTWYTDWVERGHEPMKLNLISCPSDGDGSKGRMDDHAAMAFWPDPRLLTVRSSGSETGSSQSIDLARGLQSVEVVRRPDAPALVGIRATSVWDQEGGKSIITYWLDPSRNDVPVEQDWLQVTKAGVTTFPGGTEFLEYEQLPDGRWYPTHWRTVNPDPRLGGLTHYDYRLTFDSGRSLDAKWFGDPTEHFSPVILGSTPSVVVATPGVAAKAQALFAAARDRLARSTWNWVPWGHDRGRVRHGWDPGFVTATQAIADPGFDGVSRFAAEMVT